MNNHSRRIVNIIGKATNRRSRTPNWSQNEKQFLLELIKERKEIVITKNNNGPIHCEEKDVAWNEILKELESKFGSKFSRNSMKKVKTQWQNMKRIAREEIAANGPYRQKYTKQSLEVCGLLDLTIDFVPKAGVTDNSDNDSPVLAANIEIKTEIVDEEENEKDFEDLTNTTESVANVGQNEPTQAVSSLVNDAGPFEICQEGVNKYIIDVDMTKSSTIESSVKQPSSVEPIANINSFHRDMHDSFRYTVAEKQLKLETLREEQLIVKTMKETANINKIIAERRLKQLLWIQQKQMA